MHINHLLSQLRRLTLWLRKQEALIDTKPKTPTPSRNSAHGQLWYACIFWWISHLWWPNDSNTWHISVVVVELTVKIKVPTIGRTTWDRRNLLEHWKWWNPPRIQTSTHHAHFGGFWTDGVGRFSFWCAEDMGEPSVRSAAKCGPTKQSSYSERTSAYFIIMKENCVLEANNNNKKKVCIEVGHSGAPPVTCCCAAMAREQAWCALGWSQYTSEILALGSALSKPNPVVRIYGCRARDPSTLILCLVCFDISD